MAGSVDIEIAGNPRQACFIMNRMTIQGPAGGVPDMQIDRGSFAAHFDREPFGFTHEFSSHPAFAADSLWELARKYADHPKDYFVAASAPTAGTEFFSVPQQRFKPHEAMNLLDSAGIRVLLKRPENHDPRFRRILEHLFEQVTELRGGLRGETVVRLESAVFITSAKSTTPFHFDPEIAFFMQIDGDKTYHVYAPSILAEPELEDFYLQGEVNIGQVALEGRDPGREHVFKLAAGRGLHQPQNSPHWVETGATRSISFSFVFETDVTRAAGRTRAFNHYVRKLGLQPPLPGRHPAADALKSGAMKALIPVRKRASRLLHKVTRG